VSGKEDVDRRVDVTFRDYLRSWIFRYNIIVHLLGVAYVVAFSIVTYAARASGLKPAGVSLAWSYVSLGFSTASLVMSYFFSRRKLVFRIPWKSIIRYLLATALMLGSMYPLYLYIPMSNTTVVQIARVASMIAIGIVTYFGSVIILDKEGREMIKILIMRFIG
jgi:uncharacterized membrane protein